jgi:hypothetical protein
VAASVLLAGENDADDAAALAALYDRLPRTLFREADGARLAAEPRPCLGTVYLDSAWYDNSRVELAATALALAALFGPDGRLTVEGDREMSVPSAVPFDFTAERLGVVMGMVKKKAAASMGRLKGIHFRVEPPAEYFDRPDLLSGRDIYPALQDTTWRVRWHDGTAEWLGFGEFLGFIDQVLEVESALEMVSAARGANGSAPAAPIERRPIRVNRTLDARALVRDASVRRLFAALTGSGATGLHCSFPSEREDAVAVGCERLASGAAKRGRARQTNRDRD